MSLIEEKTLQDDLMGLINENRGRLISLVAYKYIIGIVGEGLTKKQKIGIHKIIENEVKMGLEQLCGQLDYIIDSEKTRQKYEKDIPLYKVGDRIVTNAKNESMVNINKYFPHKKGTIIEVQLKPFYNGYSEYIKDKNVQSLKNFYTTEYRIKFDDPELETIEMYRGDFEVIKGEICQQEVQ